MKDTTKRAYQGGRGLKAPYETTLIRVPLPIKDEVQKLIDNYKWSVKMSEEV